MNVAAQSSVIGDNVAVETSLTGVNVFSIVTFYLFSTGPLMTFSSISEFLRFDFVD